MNKYIDYSKVYSSKELLKLLRTLKSLEIDPCSCTKNHTVGQPYQRQVISYVDRLYMQSVGHPVKIEHPNFHARYFEIPLEEIPLYVFRENISDVGKEIFKWRLFIGK